MAPKHTSAKRMTVTNFLSKADQLSIELSKMVMDPIEVKLYLEEFGPIVTPSSKTTQSFAKLFHKGKDGGMAVKMKVFGSNQTTMFDETIKTFEFDGVKLISATTDLINTVPQTADRIEIITRFSLSLTNLPNWMLELELNRSLNNPLEFSTKLQSAKDLLVGVELDKMDSSAYDYVTTTLRQIEKSPTTTAEILDIISEVQSVKGNDKADAGYQAAVYDLAKDIYRDAITISRFKHQSGFKRLCSNAVELSRPIYFKQVLSQIDNFYLTDKMDGVRAMLIIDEVYRRSGHRRIFVGTEIKAVSDKVYTIEEFVKPKASKTIETDHTVLDVEMMTDSKGKHSFHCFDVIMFASKKLAGLPFKERFSKFEAVKTLMEKYEVGTTKTFVKLSKTDYGTQIKEFYDMKRSYEIDGLIFTPEGEFYKTAVKQRKNKYDRIYNTDYASTISFKWKPLDQLTIDFYFMANPAKTKNEYILCSGVDSNTVRRLQLNFFDGYKAPSTPNSHKYFPIQFNPSDGNFDYHWSPSKEDLALCPADCSSFDGLVGEFTFADSKGRLARPKLLRLRLDRVHDIAKGEYYGNALRYAELIWHSINYPLTIETLCKPLDIGYFAVDDNDWFKAQRGFNSFVKSYLLETYLFSQTKGKARIMDLMAGKGQDLGRAIDVGYDEIVLLDRDTDALYELLERKYNLRVKRKEASANIHIKRTDFEESAESNIKALKIAKASVDSSMVNFGIHYICHEAGPSKIDPLLEFIKFNAFYLKEGGRIMITAFNGEDVFKALANNDEWSLKENGRIKYSIKRAFSSSELTDNDQAIDVLLPFSGTEYYREYLVNYDYVQKLFESNGFKLIKTDGFESLLRAYKKQNARGYNAMTAEDREYVALYGYMIFERT